MVEGFNCQTCGGSLIRYKDEDIYKCEFCGKFFSDNAECTELEALRKLMKKGKKNSARAMLQDLIASDPGNVVYLWENVNLDLKCDRISDLLDENKDDEEKLTELIRSGSYLLLKDHMLNDTLMYSKMIERYIELRKMTVSIVNTANRLNMSEQKRATAKSSAKKILDEVKKCVCELIVVILLSLYVGAKVAFAMDLSTHGAVALVLCLVVIACPSYLGGRYMLVWLSRAERNNNSREDVARLKQMRAEADELMKSIRHMEHDRFISVKG